MENNSKNLINESYFSNCEEIDIDNFEEIDIDSTLIDISSSNKVYESFLKEENKNLKNKLNELQKHITKLENDNNNLIKEKSSLDKEINNLLIFDKISKITESNLKNQINEFEKLITNLKNSNHLNEEKIVLLKEIENITKENTQLKIELDKLKDIIKSINEKNKNINENKNYKDAFELLITHLTSNYYKKKEKKSKEKEIIITEILNLRKEGKSYRKIAKIYNVSPSTIYYRVNKAQK